jgi:hypothetical protein
MTYSKHLKKHENMEKLRAHSKIKKHLSYSYMKVKNSFLSTKNTHKHVHYTHAKMYQQN